ncbi:MAG: DUF4307 domain-containing protein [Terrimesophilobacter sp.]
MADTARANAANSAQNSGAGSNLNERYGRTPARIRRTRLLAIIAAAGIAVVFVLWVIWTGLDNGQGSIDVQDIGHTIVDDANVSVTWALSVPAGTAVSCAIQAQNEAHGIVGWKIVQLPASDRFTRQFTENVRTTQQAVTGLIYRCWLT